MFDKISEDIKVCMKSGQKEKLDALRMLKSKLLENKTSTSPKPEVDVAIAHVKKLKDSLEMFPDGAELKLKTIREIDLLKDYVPNPLTEVDVKNMLTEILAQNPGANMGAVMKLLSPQIKGKFDNKLATDMIKALISK